MDDELQDIVHLLKDLMLEEEELSPDELKKKLNAIIGSIQDLIKSVEE